VLTLVGAGLLAVLALFVSARAFARCRSLVASSAALAEDDDLERRLAERETSLELGLARRNVQALSRATLFGGTGLAFWELTSGSSHHIFAGGAFGLGLVSWAACGELHRRIGYLADRRRQALRATRSGPRFTD
jgi:hypothetical protein